MYERGNQASLIEIRSAHMEDAMKPGGVLHDIAQNVLVEKVELTPADVADIILPPKQPGEHMSARWELLDDAKEAVKTLAEAHKLAIYDLAETLDMRKSESLPETDLGRIIPDQATWIIEGGANRTSVVRRHLAVEAMQKVYGEDYKHVDLFQLGSKRVISKERNGQPNAEYEVAKRITGNYLPEGELTEFDLNVASALQAGYQLSGESVNLGAIHSVERIQILEKEDFPRLVMVQPSGKKSSLMDGINAVHEIEMNEQVGSFVAEPYFQPILVTNGQYRAKDEFQATEWAHENGFNIHAPVALGDEPGFSVRHVDEEIVTAERTPVVYLNEAIILQRIGR